MAGLNNDEAAFIVGVSSQTGIDPRVLIAWATAEGAYASGGTGGHNYLNLRPFAGDPYSSVSKGGFEQFSTVQDAVSATVRRLNQPFAAPIIAAAHAHASPGAEIAAIGNSAWDAGHYGGSGGKNLRAIFSNIFTPAGLNDRYEGPQNAQAVASEAGTGSAGPADSFSTVTHNLGQGANAVTGGAAGAIVSAITYPEKIFKFLTSWRFAEVLGGFLLLLIGLALLAKQIGVSVPTPAAKVASAVTP